MMAPSTTTRGYKANARTLLRRQQLRVRSRRYFARSLTFSCVCVVKLSQKLRHSQLSFQLPIIIRINYELLAFVHSSCQDLCTFVCRAIDVQTDSGRCMIEGPHSVQTNFLRFLLELAKSVDSFV